MGRLIPLNYWIASLFGKIQAALMRITNQRTQKSNELLQPMRVIIFFACEDKFVGGILKIRDKELKNLRKKRFLFKCGIAVVWNCFPLVLTVTSFGCYGIIQGRQLTSPVAFTALSLFNLLRNPMDELVESVSSVIQAKVSINRIEQFLNESKTEKYSQLRMKRPSHSASRYIGFVNASFSWLGRSTGSDSSKANKDFRLRDLNLAFETGKLNVIVGPTGSGKTSLPLTLLREWSWLVVIYFCLAPNLENMFDSIPIPGFMKLWHTIVNKCGC